MRTSLKTALLLGLAALCACDDSNEPSPLADASASPSDASRSEDAQASSTDATASSDASDATAAPQCGAADCSGHLWPRIVVVNQSGMLTTNAWSVKFVNESGATLDAQPQPCPSYAGAPSFPCDFGLFASAQQQTFQVMVTTPEGQLSSAVTFVPNGCPSTLLRLRVVQDKSSDTLMLSDPETLNPCTAL